MLKFKFMVFALLSISLSFAGTERRGGNRLEAAFSSGIMQIETELSQLGIEANAKLKFTIDQYADASSGVLIKCAKSVKDIAYLKSKKRLAFVKNPGIDGDKIIYLNCYNSSPSELNLTEDWHDVLDGILNNRPMNTIAKVLIVHEVLRAGGLEIKEGDYRFSSSIKLAQMAQDEKTRIEMHELASSFHNDCRLISYHNVSYFIEIVRYGTNDNKRTETIIANEEESKFRMHEIFSSIINLDHKFEIEKKVLLSLKAMGCFNAQ